MIAHMDDNISNNLNNIQKFTNMHHNMGDKMSNNLKIIHNNTMCDNMNGNMSIQLYKCSNYWP